MRWLYCMFLLPVLFIAQASSASTVQTTVISGDELQEYLKSSLVLPDTYDPVLGDTWASIAAKYHCTESDLRRWNHAENRNYFKFNETIWVSKPAKDLRRYIVVGGDKAKRPLEKQIEDWNLPPPVYDALITAIAQHEYIVDVLQSTPEHPLVADKLGFGHGSWEQNVWFLTDATTGKRIYKVDADVYRRLEYEGQYYLLTMNHACTNGAMFIRPMPMEQSPPPPPPPLVYEAPPAPLMQPPPPVVAKHKRPTGWYENGVLWLRYEHVFQHGEDQNNGYTGIEEILGLPWPGDRRVALVLRASPNLNNKQWQLATRAGLRVTMVSTPSLDWKLEGGGYYDANQMQYRDTESQLRKKFFDGHGVYGRTLGYAGALSWDGTYRTGNRIWRNWDTFIQFEPGPLYSRVSYTQYDSKNREKTFDGEVVGFPDDRSTSVQGRLGYAWGDPLIIYVSWDDWRYQSPDWKRWDRGPGLGLEKDLRHDWRFIADARYFWVKEQNPHSGTIYRGHETRLAGGFVHTW